VFWRFVAMARACGPVSFDLHKGTIVLRGARRIFASIQVRADGLDGHVNLARQVTDRRFRKLEQFTGRLFFHRHHLATVSDLDEDSAAGCPRHGTSEMART
jgi:hypothetical protein